jgi:cold shock CspA family protein
MPTVDKSKPSVVSTGTVRWYDADRRYGFATDDTLQADVFIHRNQLVDQASDDDLQPGARLSYTRILVEKGWKAVMIRLRVRAGESKVAAGV